MIGSEPPETARQGRADREERQLVFCRVGACFADGAILLLVLLSLILVGETALKNPAGGPLFVNQAARLSELMIPYGFLWLILCFSYFTLFHFVSGQTPGKMLCHLRVADESGKPLCLRQAFLRSAAGVLSFLVLGAGYWVIFFDPRAKGWNDRLAGTRVLRVGQAEEE